MDFPSLPVSQSALLPPRLQLSSSPSKTSWGLSRKRKKRRGWRKLSSCFDVCLILFKMFRFLDFKLLFFNQYFSWNPAGAKVCWENLCSSGKERSQRSRDDQRCWQYLSLPLFFFFFATLLQICTSWLPMVAKSSQYEQNKESPWPLLQLLVYIVINT